VNEYHKLLHRGPYAAVGPHVGKPLTTIRAGYLDLDRRIILKPVFKKWDWWITDWIHLAQDSDRWLVFLNAVMNLQVP
jgi:hypothetical protein